MARCKSAAMAQRAASRRAQRGVALMALLAVAVMVFAYVLTSRLNAASRFVAIDRDHNAKVMSQAKQALVGWMAMNAAGTDDDPGRLPCPEAPGDFNTVNEGRPAGSCLPPNNVGRLPWRKLGLPKLVDAAGEPLWYAVSPGWSLPGASATPINSDSTGQLAFNGVANDAVALLIAPGAVLSIQAGGACATQAQSRPTAGPLNVRNYLECGNESGNFVTAAPGQTFNDQVLRVTAADLIPALEAAVAHRMQREIAPALRNVYAALNWGLTGSSRVFPYAAPFDDPDDSTSTYQGDPTKTQGLLPFNYSQGCTPGPSDLRCDPSFVRWSATAPTVTLSGVSLPNVFPCTFTSVSTVECTGPYVGLGLAVQLRFDGVVNNVARALKTLDPSGITVEYRRIAPPQWTSAATTTSSALRNNGHANIYADATIPGLLGLSYEFRVYADLSVVADHPLLDATSTGAGSTGWFVRNKWYQLVHYATAPGYTASALPTPGCMTGLDCLSISNLPPAGTQRAILILTGRNLTGVPRPSATPAPPSDYLEFGNAQTPAAFELQPVSTVIDAALKKPFNDRFVVLDANP